MILQRHLPCDQVSGGHSRIDSLLCPPGGVVEPPGEHSEADLLPLSGHSKWTVMDPLQQRERSLRELAVRSWGAYGGATSVVATSSLVAFKSRFSSWWMVWGLASAQGVNYRPFEVPPSPTFALTPMGSLPRFQRFLPCLHGHF